ncbi:MAG: hypothetical protein I8H68_08365 [Flavobacteriia bacterium]|nr:hypothetical protein [Flavobacteriia bacterium]MBH2023808.1 hypothetical protein [Flavobacteriales bacterium]
MRSPVSGSQTLQQFSPSTLADRFYIYDTSTDIFKAVVPSATLFAPAQGYLIRMRNNHVTYSPGISAQSWTGTFTGKPNNGTVSLTVSGEGQGYNTIANPYPSEIDADTFMADNADAIGGTLYFWRRRNSTPDQGNTMAYYATYTEAGGTAVPTADPNIPSIKPNGYIQVGQGFLVQNCREEVKTSVLLIQCGLLILTILSSVTPAEKREIEYGSISPAAAEGSVRCSLPICHLPRTRWTALMVSTWEMLPLH